MKQTPSPYEAPSESRPYQTWWSKLLSFFRTGNPFGEHLGVIKFLDGNIFIFEGIGFFVDPEDPKMVYAASPSQELTNQRVNLVVSEAVRLLPLLLANAPPSLIPHLKGRKLAVRLVEDYACARTSVLREHLFSWDVMSEMLNDSSESAIE